jgi:hypothetical protein
MVVRHDVADPTAWRRAFEGALPLRRAEGELAAHVEADPLRPERITAVFVWRSAIEARAFAGSEMLAHAMHRTGVQGAAEITLVADGVAERIDVHADPSTTVLAAVRP